MFPSREVYGLNSQITRATVSIMSNSAEGFDRFSSREFIKHLRNHKDGDSKISEIIGTYENN